MKKRTVKDFIALDAQKLVRDCEEYLEEYLALDCYFSVGPDVWWNPAVAQAARRVPRDRILVETDGLGAVQWPMRTGQRMGSGRLREQFQKRWRTQSARWQRSELCLWRPWKSWFLTIWSVDFWGSCIVFDSLMCYNQSVPIVYCCWRGLP